MHGTPFGSFDRLLSVYGFAFCLFYLPQPLAHTRLLPFPNKGMPACCFHRTVHLTTLFNEQYNSQPLKPSWLHRLIYLFFYAPPPSPYSIYPPTTLTYILGDGWDHIDYFEGQRNLGSGDARDRMGRFDDDHHSGQAKDNDSLASS